MNSNPPIRATVGAFRASPAPLLAFVGGGNMACAILGGLVAAGHPASRVVVVEPHAPQADVVREKFGVRVRARAGRRPALAGADIVVWAVKPQVFRDAARAVRALRRRRAAPVGDGRHPQRRDRARPPAASASCARCPTRRR